MNFLVKYKKTTQKEWFSILKKAKNYLASCSNKSKN